MKLKSFSVMVMLLSLTACFHDSDDPPYQFAQSIDVITVSGLIVTLNGTWVRPCDTNASGYDYLITETISRNVGIHTNSLHTSTDGSCSGTLMNEAIYEFTIKAGAVMAITGWVELSGAIVDPPLAQDGSGPLLNNESVTSLTLTINSVNPPDPNYPPGAEVPAFYVVDDTVAGAPVMYGISDNDKQKPFNVPMTLQ